MTTNDIEQVESPRLLLTVQQAAARLGIGRTLCYDLIASGTVSVITDFLTLVGIVVVMVRMDSHLAGLTFLLLPLLYTLAALFRTFGRQSYRRVRAAMSSTPPSCGLIAIHRASRHFWISWGNASPFIWCANSMPVPMRCRSSTAGPAACPRPCSMRW